jgi:hypothetical protein
MRLTVNVLIIAVLLLLISSNSFASQPSRYHHYVSTDILHIDVYQERLGDVVAYINEHFKANITLQTEIHSKLISLRCESTWMNVVLHICANESLEILPSKKGLFVKNKS